MKTWNIRRDHGTNGPTTIQGDTLPKAVIENWPTIAKATPLGNAAGVLLESVRLEYSKGILGGQGGVVVTIVHRGQDLAHMPAESESKTSTVWIYAGPDDLPAPLNIPLNSK